MGTTAAGLLAIGMIAFAIAAVGCVYLYLSHGGRSTRQLLEKLEAIRASVDSVTRMDPVVLEDIEAILRQLEAIRGQIERLSQQVRLQENEARATGWIIADWMRSQQASSPKSSRRRKKKP